MVAPYNTITALSFNIRWQSQEYIDQVFESLKGKSKRSWFVNHAYHCLPLVIGNQYGFVVKSLYDFEVEWNGGDEPEDVKLNITSSQEEYEDKKDLMSIEPHFGMGTFTVQTAYQLKTPPGINLMTINPPNSFIDGIYHMTGVVEADNLKRDFTYNLRITRPNYKIKFNKGDYIGCVVPYPRNFIDYYNIIDATKVCDYKELEKDLESSVLLSKERRTVDVKKKNKNGKRYWRGEDAWGNKFQDHQTSLSDMAEVDKTKIYKINNKQENILKVDKIKNKQENILKVDFPIIFENIVIKENSQKIIDYINNHIFDFGKLGEDFWDGRNIYANDIKDPNILKIIEDGKDYMLYEFTKRAKIKKPIYPDILSIIRWTEGYELQPHADAVEPDGSDHPYPWRDFGTVTFLNEDFEGGILHYPEKLINIPAKTGNTVVHTGGLDCLHGVTKITKGVRYTIASFLTFDKSFSLENH